jgi:hypothetical protein
MRMSIKIEAWIQKRAWSVKEAGALGANFGFGSQRSTRKECLDLRRTVA